MKGHAMRCLSLSLLAASLGAAAELKKLPANTFVPIEYRTLQFPGSDDKGQFSAQGWNKIVYDPDCKRVLLYDRWLDKTHGGYTIYGNSARGRNCSGLFASHLFSANHFSSALILSR
jgi:hypothetical protein